MNPPPDHKKPPNEPRSNDDTAAAQPPSSGATPAWVSWVLPLLLLAGVAFGIWYVAIREDPATKAGRLLVAATQAMDTFEYAKAEQLLRDAMKVRPNNAWLHHLLGVLQIRQGRNEEARNTLELAVTLYPPEARAQQGMDYFELATLDFNEKKWAEAVRHLRLGTRADPKNPLLHTRLIDMQLAGLQDLAAADSSTLRFLDACGRTPRNFLDAGKIHYKRGSYSSAQHLAEAAVFLADTLTEAHALLANTYWKTQRIEEGLALIDEPLRRFPNAKELWVAQAGLFVGGKRFAEAHRALDRALELAPQDYEANLARLMCFTLERREAEALEQARLCLKLTSDENELQFLKSQVRGLEASLLKSANPAGGS